MNEQINSNLVTLYESYENNPTIKGLIQILPFAPVVDSLLSTYVNKNRAEKLFAFFEELNSGETELTEDIIRSDDFLHAYFSTINYVIRTRSDEKVRCFARILKNLSSEKITVDEFEDYTAIFNELSEREFVILSLKYNYEKKNESNTSNLNPLQLASIYWEQFKSESCEKIYIEQEEFNSMLVRIQRTGCYEKFQGYYDGGSSETIGNTTELFKKIYRLIG